MTGRWSRKDQHVRSIEAAKMLASVSDRTLGHLVTERWRVASGPADVAAHRELPCDWMLGVSGHEKSSLDDY